MITGTPGEQVIKGTDADGQNMEFRLRDTLLLSNMAEEPIATFYIYDIYESGMQVHAMRLGVTDEVGSPAWIDLPPVMFESLAEWLFKEAAKLRAGDPS